MSDSVLIVGGGISGLASAYFLNQAGWDVTVIDRGQLDNSASIGNAGFLSMYEKSPMSYPGVFLDTFRAFLKNRSPMIINTPLDPRLLRWGYHFYKASKKPRYRRTLAILEHFGEEVFEFYQQLTQAGIDCEYHRDGFALVYTAPETYQKKLLSIPENSPYYEVFSRKQIAEYFPFMQEDKVAGAVLLKRNGHLNPGKVISGLKTYLDAKGVKFILGQEVQEIERSHGKVTAVVTASGSYSASQYIICTGSNLTLAKKLQTDLVITPGRGYSITFQMDAALKPRLPALFCDIYTALTPRHHDVRITGKIEFGATKKTPSERVDDLVGILKNYTKDFELRDGKIWTGDRPLTGSDSPYLGRDARFQNCSYIMGTGHTGMNIGPICARILSEMLTQNQRNVENADLLLMSEFYQS